MPRGSNGEQEVARVRSSEKSDFRSNIQGQGARHREKPGYGRKTSNPKPSSARSPRV